MVEGDCGYKLTGYKLNYFNVVETGCTEQVEERWIEKLETGLRKRSQLRDTG